MTARDHEPLAPGARCLCRSQGGRWRPATILAAHPDGTFKIEYDEKELVFLPTWDGVPAEQIVVGDEARWPEVYASLTSDVSGLGLDDFCGAFARLSSLATSDELRSFWRAACEALFQTASAESDGLRLGPTEAYRLFLRAGVCARSFAEPFDPGLPRYVGLYWNQLRMGGRDPRDLPREVTIDDAFVALGLRRGAVDPARLSALRAAETRERLSLPAELIELLSHSDVEAAVKDIHPNNPDLVPPPWSPEDIHRRGDRPTLPEAFAVPLMEHQAGVWSAAFSAGDARAQVFLERDEDFFLVAPSIAMFLWDLAQTGLAWWSDPTRRERRSVARTDIGLRPG